MKVVLDTHVVLWWLSDPDEIAAPARELIASGEHLVYLSAAVIWEIRIKEALKKLRLPRGFERVLAASLFEELPVRIAHAHQLHGLPAVHRDPFDRLLVAQAQCEEAVLVTRDRMFRRYNVPTFAA